jgi:hypothetical protein
MKSLFNSRVALMLAVVACLALAYHAGFVPPDVAFALSGLGMMGNVATTQETLELLKAAHGNPNSELAKAWTQSASAVSGITAYDLEAPAKQLYPVITPLRNEIPRVSGKGGIQAAWRAVTGVNTTSVLPGVSGGNRGGIITTTTADYTAAYKGLGLEDTVTFEADYAAENFQDVKALAVEGLLRSMMIAEERVILGGNSSMALGNTPTPTLSSANTGGGLTGNIGYGVGVVALDFEAYMLASVTTGVVQSIARTNADSSTDTINGGTARPSSQANVINANTGATTTISATVAAVPGAVAYAWFWGANSGNLTLGAITTINSVLITAAAAGTASGSGVANFQALTAADKSQNSLEFDGLLTFASQSALGSYQKVMATGNAGAGTALTPDNRGGVVEIDTALKSFWDNYRLSPDTLWVNSQEMSAISNATANTTTSGAQRIVFATEPGKVVAGAVITRSYLNKYAMNGATELQIRLHPNMPAGTMLFTTSKLPYPLSNVTNVMQMRMRRDYYQIEWPQTTRKYQYGIYEDGVLQHFFPPSMGVITNIAAGT